MSRVFATPADLLGAIGEQLGGSGYVVIEQDLIDRFAGITGDRAWIHIDVERAATGPYGGTVAHGYLTLSLVTALLTEILRVNGTDFVLNKGLDRVRFATPVRAGAKVRAVAVLDAATARPRGFVEAVVGVKVHVENEPVPALSARQRLLYHCPQ